MTYAIQDPAIRRVAPCDAEITEFVAAAMVDGPVPRRRHRHHARPDVVGLPACPEANHASDRNLYQRHGYQVRSVIDPPDGPSLCTTMWRSPMNC